MKKTNQIFDKLNPFIYILILVCGLSFFVASLFFNGKISNALEALGIGLFASTIVSLLINLQNIGSQNRLTLKRRKNESRSLEYSIRHYISCGAIRCDAMLNILNYTDNKNFIRHLDPSLPTKEFYETFLTMNNEERKLLNLVLNNVIKLKQNQKLIFDQRIKEEYLSLNSQLYFDLNLLKKCAERFLEENIVVKEIDVFARDEVALIKELLKNMFNLSECFEKKKYNNFESFVQRFNEFNLNLIKLSEKILL